jgi:hypothetical protein
MLSVPGRNKMKDNAEGLRRIAFDCSRATQRGHERPELIDHHPKQENMELVLCKEKRP